MTRWRSPRALVALTLVLAGPRASEAASRRPYGGVSRISVLEPVLALDPRRLESPSDVALSGLVYETLYRLEPSGALRPVLARAAPELRGSTLWVPLRGDVVFHDGRALTPAAVRAHFVALADPGSASAWVMAPVRGTLERAAGDPSAEPRITARDEDLSIGFELVAPSVDFARWLAAPESAVVTVDPGSGALPLGTGPFSPVPISATSASARGDALRLAAFSRHREGRPFLDAVDIELGGPRRGRSAPPRGALVLGAVGLGTSGRGTSLPRSSGAPVELIVLAVGDGALDTPRARRAVDQTLDRAILARRFLGAGSEPARSLALKTSSEVPASAAPLLAGDRPLRATLVVSSRDPELRRAADRIQLDLLRAGLTVIIEPLSPAALESKRRDRSYDLMLARTRTHAAAPSTDAVAGLDALLALAQTFAATPQLTPAELAAALKSPDEARRQAPLLEARLRDDEGLLPLATRTPELHVDAALQGVRLGPSGTLDLADAHLDRPEPAARSSR